MGDAVTLADGRVLAVGMEIVDDPDQPQANAELYDPRTNRWTMTSPLVGLVEFDVTATVLRSGRVLVAGGNWRPSQGESSKVQLFDAETERWSEGPPIPLERPLSYPGAVLLTDGRVLLAGGGEAALFVEAGLEITDTPPPPTATETASPTVTPSPTFTVTPSPTNTSTPTPTVTPTPPAYGYWRPTSPMVVPRWGHAAVLLDDGRVLVAGGYPTGQDLSQGAGTLTASAEIYDPTTDSWQPTAPMNVERVNPGAFVLADGRVAVVGGNGPGYWQDASYWLRSYEVYDPVRGTWQLVTLDVPNLGTSYVRLDEHQVLVSGINKEGTPCGTTSVTSTLTIDLYSDQVEPGPPMRVDRMGHAGVKLADGRVMLAGGKRRSCFWDCSGGSIGYNCDWYVKREPIPDVDILEPGAAAFDSGPRLPAKHDSFCTNSQSVLLRDGSYIDLCIEGLDWYRFNPRLNAWERLPTPGMPRAKPAVAQLSNRLALFAGGDWAGPEAHAAELYDPSTGRWFWVHESKEGMTGSGASITPLGSNRALFVGPFFRDLYHPNGVSQIYTYTTPEPRRTQVFIPVVLDHS